MLPLEHGPHRVPNEWKRDVDRSRRGARIGALIPMAVGALVLIGWWLDLSLLKSGVPGYVTMKPNTAFGLLLAGTSLLLLEPEHRSANRTRQGYVAAIGCGMIGTLTLLEYLGSPGWLSIDQLIFAVPEDLARTATPGRMAAATAIGFVGLCVALLLFDARRPIPRLLRSLAISATAAMPLAVLVGYVYRAIPVQGVGQGLQMAIHTAGAFLTLAMGLLLARPHRGVTRMLRAPGPGGVLLRRLMPVALGAPVALGLLRLAAESSGVMDPAAATAVATVGTMFVLAWVAWRTAVTLDETNTARLIVEEVVAQRNAELELANSRLLEAQEAAEAASAAKSEFLSRMSHELRTPLNSIIGFVGVLLRNRDGRFAPTEIEYLECVKRNGQHLLALINDVLDIARIEAGKMTVALEEVSLDRLVAQTLSELKGAERLGATVVTAEIPVGLAALETDALKLKQIVLNLVGNALKFTADGRITVRVVADTGGQTAARIDVVDTGIGIPAERLEAIFGAFEQADSQTGRRYGGTGLGLSISRAFANALGYRLAVRSTAGVGSVFSVLLDPEAQPPKAAAWDWVSS